MLMLYTLEGGIEYGVSYQEFLDMGYCIVIDEDDASFEFALTKDVLEFFDGNKSLFIHDTRTAMKTRQYTYGVNIVKPTEKMLLMNRGMHPYNDFLDIRNFVELNCMHPDSYVGRVLFTGHCMDMGLYITYVSVAGVGFFCVHTGDGKPMGVFHRSKRLKSKVCDEAVRCYVSKMAMVQPDLYNSSFLRWLRGM